MDTSRENAIIVGVFYIVATVAGMLSLPFTEPALNAPDYLVNVSASENQVLIGALIELIMAVAVAGIGITVYPVIRKYNVSSAIGYFGARIVEGVIFFIGVISLLTLLTLSQEFVKAGAPDASYFQSLGTLLLAARDWGGHVLGSIAFSLGALMFYYLLYQLKLIPRWLSVWGLIGAPLALAEGLLIMFDIIDPLSTNAILLNLPLAVNEIVLAVWLIVKGFNSSAIASGSAETDINKV